MKRIPVLALLALLLGGLLSAPVLGHHRPWHKPKPTPTPTVAPTPTATPSPTPAPTPTAPPSACTRTATADASGATDATAGLQADVNATPAGGTLCLVANGQYRVTRLNIARKVNFTLDGNGARLFVPATRTNDRIVLIYLSSDITLRELTIEGTNPNAGTSNAHVYAWEFQHGIDIAGSSDVDVSATIRNTSGDGIYLTGGQENSTDPWIWSNNVRIHDCSITRNGRMGVAITDGARDIVVERCNLDAIAMYAFDIEPNGIVKDGVLTGGERVRFSDNTVGSYTIDADWGPYLLALTGNGPSVDIEFSRNVVAGPLRVWAFDSGGARSGVRVLDNQGSAGYSGVMTFRGVNGLTVTGNTGVTNAQVTTTNCTNVVISGNVTQ